MANDKVLVYHHHHSAKPISEISNGLAVITKEQLEDVLKKSKCLAEKCPDIQFADTMTFTDPSLQRTSVPIPKGATHIELQERDLLTDTQKAQWAGKPNYEQNVAGIKVPLKVVLGNIMGAEGFGEMVVLSEKRD